MNFIVSELVNMDWSKVEGARQQRRTIILREGKDSTFLSPVDFCENRQFFSKRVAESTLTQSTDGITILT